MLLHFCKFILISDYGMLYNNFNSISTAVCTLHTFYSKNILYFHNTWKVSLTVHNYCSKTKCNKCIFNCTGIYCECTTKNKSWWYSCTYQIEKCNMCYITIIILKNSYHNCRPIFKHFWNKISNLFTFIINLFASHTKL